MTEQTTTVDLAAWLTRIWDEEEQIALEASRHDEEPLVVGGEHWLWACDEHDEVVVPDPLTQEFVECPQGGWARVSLRSVEQYPYRAIPGTGPSIHLHTEELPPSIALHISRHDPASVLARIAADRKILALHTPFRLEFDRITGCATCSYRNNEEELQVTWPCPTLRLLASPYADRPGFREEWR